eukprot:Ihof_evm3s349 gene=Ihof_evmTU3s349
MCTASKPADTSVTTSGDKFPYVPIGEFKLEGEEEVISTLAGNTGLNHDELLRALATPPSFVSVRANTLKLTRDQMANELQALWDAEGLAFTSQPHPVLPDVLMIGALSCPNFPEVPSTTKAVILSRICGESVCRGSHVYARGIRAASVAIGVGDVVSVYVDLTDSILAGSVTSPKIASEHTLLYIGLGKACMTRTEIFTATRGLAVQINELCFPQGPSLNGVLSGSMYVQGLPSALVAHVLGPQPGEIVLDMCACPGAKATHIAALMKNEGIFVANCRSKSKRKALIALCESFGVDQFVKPIKIDSTNCILDEPSDGPKSSLQSILDEYAATGKCNGYPIESFDKVLLDPPCSALGLRPRLKLDHFSVTELTDQHPQFQKSFLWAAVQLVKPGGTLVYSTCTLNPHENEAMVSYALSKYPLQLVDPNPYKIGSP